MNIKTGQKYKKFEYDSGLKIADLMRDPEIIVKKVENALIICQGCGRKFTFRFTEHYITGKCKCGCMIIKPTAEGYYSYRYVSAEQYDKDKCDNDGNQKRNSER